MSSEHRGLFITIEGGEGSGKSTQIALLSAWLENNHIPHLITREPGGTVQAEKIRALLVKPQEEEWLPESEMLLFMAARVEHVRNVIQPALNEGKVVISDRFHDSSRIYQGIAKGLGIAYYDHLHRMMLGGVTPDMTILLDIDPEAGLQRAASRQGVETRFEALGTDFHQRLREGFLALAKKEPQRFHVLDASQSPEQLHEAIIGLLPMLEEAA